MLSRTKWIAGFGLAVAVGISVSGCATTQTATPLSTTSAAASTSADPAEVGGAGISPGPYRIEATVTAVDTVARAVVATIPVEGNPTGLAVDPTTHDLWVVSDAGVSVIDPATHAVTTTIGVDDDPQYIAVDPQERTAYVTHSGMAPVSLIDTVSRTRLDSISLGERGSAYAVAVDPVEHTVYLTGLGFNTVTMIDARTREVTAVRSSGITPSNEYGSKTRGAAVDPATHHLYVTNSDAGQIEVIAHR